MTEGRGRGDEIARQRGKGSHGEEERERWRGVEVKFDSRVGGRYK